MKKSWEQKMSGNEIKIIELDEKAQKQYKGAKTMVIASPADVYEIMSKVPIGSLITVSEIRTILSKKYQTDTTCPLTSGIFIWIAANAAQEMFDNNKIKEIIPFWRTLKSDGLLVEKYPGGLLFQKKMLEDEGFSVIQKGKNLVVDNFKSFIFSDIF